MAQSKFTIQDAPPELRIVSDELWERVREQNRRVHNTVTSVSGMNRTANATYD